MSRIRILDAAVIDRIAAEDTRVARALLRELGIDFQDRIICGKFIDEDRPTFSEMKDKHYTEVLGDKYSPMPPEGGWIHE